MFGTIAKSAPVNKKILVVQITLEYFNFENAVYHKCRVREMINKFILYPWFKR